MIHNSECSLNSDSLKHLKYAVLTGKITTKCNDSYRESNISHIAACWGMGTESWYKVIYKAGVAGKG